MRRYAQLSVVLVVAMLAMLALPASSMALIVTKTTAPSCNTYAAKTIAGEKTVPLPKFNMAGVTLTGVTLTQYAALRSNYVVTADDDPGHIVTVDYYGNADTYVRTPGVPDLTLGLSVSKPGNTYPSVGTFTGNVDSTDKHGAYQIADLAAWTGSGTVVSVANTTGAVTGSSPDSGNVGVQVITSADAKLCVAYTYTEEILVCIGDYVWYDDNKDGIQDAGEQGVPGRPIVVTDSAGRPLGTTATDANGRWKVCQLEPDTACIVDVDLPEGWNLTSLQTGTRANDSDGRPKGADAVITDCITPPAGEDLTFDVGIHQTPVPVEAPAPAPGKLRLTKAANMKTTRSGGRVRFTVRVTNRGSRVLRNVRVCDTPPAQFAFTSRPRKTTLRNGKLCWTLKTLRAKKTVTLRYTMRAAKVPARTCATNRVTGTAPGTTASAKRTVCIRPTKLGMLQLAG